VVEAPEPLQADDTDRPRADAALAEQALEHGGCRHGAELLELEAAANANESGRPSRMEAQCAELGRREAADIGGRGRNVQAADRRRHRPEDAALERSGAARGDELATEGAQEPVCDGREARRTEAAELARSPSEERVAGKAPQERRMVGVERQHEAEQLETGLALRSEHHSPVGLLPGMAELSPVPDRQDRRHQPVGERARRVRRERGRQAKRVRATRPNGCLDHTANARARWRRAHTSRVAAALALTLYAIFLAVAAVAVWRRPIVALYLFLPGLALHNLGASLLWEAGVRGAALDVILAWKEILLAAAVLSVALAAWRRRRLPFQPGLVDGLAFAFAAIAVVYALVPQSILGGSGSAQAALYGLRHALLPVAAYFVGRSVVLSGRELGRLGVLLVASAAAVAVFGLIDLYAIPVEWWRRSGAVGYFHDQLGFDLHGPGGLPENFAYNSSDGVFRRLVSTFISPLGAAFMFVVALLVAASPGAIRRRPRLTATLAAIIAAALLFTLSRSSLIALAAGLVVLALAHRRLWPLGAAAAAVVAGLVFAVAFPHIGSRTHFFAADLAYQKKLARERGGLPSRTILSPADPSIRSHLSSLRDGLDRVVHHPQGYGLGNTGAVARRFDQPLKAGESNYAEIGVETGLAGLLLFLAWNLGLLAALVRQARTARDGDVRWLAGAIAAALAAVLVLAVQTDAYGVPWLAVCVWWLGGSVVVPGTALAAARSERPLAARRPATVVDA
jgi:hypothetical protein